MFFVYELYLLQIMYKLRNDEEKVIGILSGTSADAVDVALVNIKSGSDGIDLNVEAFENYPIESELRNYILLCSSKEKVQTELICKLNFTIGNLFSDSILSFLKYTKTVPSDVFCIGSHGQTIHHIPTDETFLNYSNRSTLQIGEPSVIAKRTGIDTVADFRVADISVGGQGAPLVSYLDYILFKSSEPKVLLNIGGISNITFLKTDCNEDEVVAFDCGPGNMMIDSLIRIFFNKKYDEDGSIAMSGNVNSGLFDFMKSYDSFIESPVPKTTGREYYGEEFLKEILNFSESLGISKQDIITTVSEFTVYGICEGIKHALQSTDSFELLISGGGVHNKYLLKRLSEEFPNVKIDTGFKNGITPDNKEAVLFALLGYQAMSGIQNNIPSATGARVKTILGKICPAA